MGFIQIMNIKYGKQAEYIYIIQNRGRENIG